MVFDTAKLKNRESTIRPVTRGRDAAKELILKVDTLLVFTIDFSEIQSVVSHNSQSDGQNKSAKRWTSFQKEIIQVVSFQRNGFVYSRWRSTVTHGECRRRHFTRHFSHVCTFTHCIRCGMCASYSLHGSKRAIELCLSVVNFFSSTLHLHSVQHFISNVPTASRETTAAFSHNEECCTMTIYHPPTGKGRDQKNSPTVLVVTMRIGVQRNKAHTVRFILTKRRLAVCGRFDFV